MRKLLLALDTATEITTVGLAWLTDDRVTMFAGSVVDAPRAAMSRLLPTASSLLSANGLSVHEVDEVVVGRGPGSFTGVRIGVATAKGLAHGLGVPLRGVGTLDAVAWGFTHETVLLGIVGDAMRGEVYPALFRCGRGIVSRITPDRVSKPGPVAEEWAALGEPLLLAGNGLRKYGEVFAETLGAQATLADEEYWPPYARGLFGAYVCAMADEELGSGEPGEVLPVYTRLSDAEEAEALRAGGDAGATPASGVAGGEVR
jgi:bifunctional N6-L-threonylcarbamoyladenine synthase / protein kinase Bud32